MLEVYAGSYVSMTFPFSSSVAYRDLKDVLYHNAATCQGWSAATMFFLCLVAACGTMSARMGSWQLSRHCVVQWQRMWPMSLYWFR